MFLDEMGVSDWVGSVFHWMTVPGAISITETEDAVGESALCVLKWSWAESCVSQSVLSDRGTPPFSLWPLDNDTVEIVEKESVR